MTRYSDYDRLGLKRNVVMNGNYNVWRIGYGPFTTPTAQTADSVGWGESMITGQAQVSRETTLIPNNNSSAAYKMQVTTAQSSLTSSEYIHMFHKIDGYTAIYKLLRKPLQLSFWIYASVAGTYCCWLRNGTATASVVQDFTINSANTWEYKVVRFPQIDNSIGTWNYGTGIGLTIGFTPACGSTFHTPTLGQWVSGNYIASSNISNTIQQTVNNVFILSQVKLEDGEIVTEFDNLQIEKESLSTYRFFQTFFVDSVQALSIQTGTGLYYAHVNIYPMNAAPTVYQMTSPLMWSPGHAWQTPTSTASTYMGIQRVTLVFHDTANSGYIAGQVGLIRITTLSLTATL